MSIWKDPTTGSKCVTNDDMVVRSRMGFNETAKTLHLPGFEKDTKNGVVNLTNRSKQGD